MDDCQKQEKKKKKEKIPSTQIIHIGDEPRHVSIFQCLTDIESMMRML